MSNITFRSDLTFENLYMQHTNTRNTQRYIYLQRLNRQLRNHIHTYTQIHTLTDTPHAVTANTKTHATQKHTRPANTHMPAISQQTALQPQTHRHTRSLTHPTHRHTQHTDTRNTQLMQHANTRVPAMSQQTAARSLLQCPVLTATHYIALQHTLQYTLQYTLQQNVHLQRNNRQLRSLLKRIVPATNCKQTESLPATSQQTAESFSQSPRPYCNTAAHCSTLQHTATHCNTHCDTISTCNVTTDSCAAFLNASSSSKRFFAWQIILKRQLYNQCMQQMW